MSQGRQAELSGVRSAFCIVVARWCLSQAEVAGLLGLDAGGMPMGKVLPDVLGVRAETSLRLLIRADVELVRLMPDQRQLASWLRTGTAAYDGRSPLTAFCDLADLHAVVRVLEAGVL